MSVAEYEAIKPASFTSVGCLPDHFLQLPPFDPAKPILPLKEEDKT